MYLRSGNSYPKNATRSVFHTKFILQCCLFREKRKGQKRKRKQRDYVKCNRLDGNNTEIWSLDIIREILLRLPLYNVSCVRQVGKSWLDLVSDPSFSTEYMVKNTVLLGFSYAIKVEDKYQIFAPITFIPLPAAVNCCPQYCFSLRNSIKTASETHKYSSQSLPPHLQSLPPHLQDYELSYSCDRNLCSCDGIILRLQIHRASQFLSLHNPVSGESVFLPSLPILSGGIYGSIDLASYGLATDFLSSQPQINVVELIQGTNTYSETQQVGCLLVNTFSSQARCWKSKEHHVEHVLGENYLLGEQGIHLNGVIYWLVTTSGVLAYDVCSESFNFALLDIPGDVVVDGKCFCSKLEPFSETGSIIGRSDCMCRYLGKSQNRLCYIRVIADSCIIYWTVCHGRWSTGRCYTLHGLPDSLAYGRVLCIDPQDCKLVYIRIKAKIFSYHLVLHQLKEIHTMKLESQGDSYQRIAPIFCYESPKVPTSLRLKDCVAPIFESSLCCKDACWGNDYVKYMIHPDTHVHSPSDLLSDSSSVSEHQSWFSSHIVKADARWSFPYFYMEEEVVSVL